MKQASWLSFLPFALFLILAIALLVRLWSGQNSVRSREGYSIESIALVGVDGKKITLPNPQQKVIVNFFASWCVACIAEHEQLKTLQKAGTPVIGIAWHDAENDTKNFLKTHGNPYTQVVLDQEGRAGVHLGITGIPETFVLREDGKIIYHFAGALTEEQVQNMLEKIAR